jgi:transposase
MWSQDGDPLPEADMSEQDRLAFWTKALNLPAFRVVHERRDAPDDPVRFTVAPMQEVAVCPHCGHACDTVHRRCDSKPIKDLPLGPHAVELIVRTPQFACGRCQAFFTPSYAAVAPGAHATERFLEQAARLIRFADIANVAQFFRVPENTLARWYYDYVERQQQQAPCAGVPIRSIGIDELSLKKSTVSSSP